LSRANFTIPELCLSAWFHSVAVIIARSTEFNSSTGFKLDESFELNSVASLAILLGCFGLISLLMGTAGFYGVMSYTVARRTKGNWGAHGYRR
jgi:hypothetical protein